MTTSNPRKRPTQTTHAMLPNGMTDWHTDLDRGAIMPSVVLLGAAGAAGGEPG